VILEEPVIHRRVAPDVAKAQLHHLLEAAGPPASDSLSLIEHAMEQL
jgi:hypothetical protein